MTAAGATATRPTRPAGVKPVIRLKAPLDGETVIEDQVQGRVVWQNKDLDDLVLLRSDGTPTYMLAVVVDDHDMGVTHVIRGDDHLTNAARQTQIYEAMGWTVPAFAHIPLIHGPDGAKLSKRHGALGVDAYRAMGYLPAALRNYLVRLGWSHGDQEIFSTEEMIAAFDLSRHRPLAGALRLRQAGEPQRPLHAQHAPTPSCWRRSKAPCPICRTGRRWRQSSTHELRAKLLAAMPGLKERAKTLIELIDGAGVPARRAAARARRQGRRAADAGGAGAARRACRRLRGGGAVDGGGAGAAVRALRRERGRQARPGRPAAARGADRPHDLARHLRRAGGARPRREPRPHARPRQRRDCRRRARSSTCAARRRCIA